MTLRSIWIALGFPERDWERRAHAARLRHDWKTLEALTMERAASDWYRPARKIETPTCGHSDRIEDE